MSTHCSCPADGSRYCGWCQSLAARAGVVLTETQRGRDYRVLAPQAVAVAEPPAVLTEEAKHPPYWPYRSRLEQRYAVLLHQWQQDGMVARWRYEALRMRLAPETTITVDWLLTMPTGVGDGRLQLHETKGLWHREDGWQKLKQAAALYPEFRFFLVQWEDNQWIWKEVPSA